MFIFVFIALLMVGCSNNESITDEITKSSIEQVSSNKDLITYTHRYDNMDRGQHDYYVGQLVIDPEYYSEHSPKRGDVVFFKNPYFSVDTTNQFEFSISRIIGLSGERAKIIKGQIYINGQILDTFYGEAHRLGQDIDGLKKLLEGNSLESHIRLNIENNIKIFQCTNIKEVKVPEGSVFIVGDDWYRSGVGQSFESLPIDNIQGKVLGYLAETD